MKILIISSNRAVSDAISEAFGIFMPQAEVTQADPGNAVEKFLIRFPEKVVICESGSWGDGVFKELEEIASGTPAVVLRLSFCNGSIADSKKVARILKGLMKIIG